MTWFGWVFIGIQVVSSAVCVTQIHKPRPRLTPGVVLGGIVIAAALCWGAVTVGTV